MNKINQSDLLALDELYTARESFRRSALLAGLDLDYELTRSLYSGLRALGGDAFAGRVLGVLNARPGTTLVEVATEILEEE